MIDTPPIILAEVSQKEQNNQQSNVWIQVPAEEQPKEEEVAPPNQSTKKKKKGGKKKQKKKVSWVSFYNMMFFIFCIAGW